MSNMGEQKCIPTQHNLLTDVTIVTITKALSKQHFSVSVKCTERLLNKPPEASE